MGTAIEMMRTSVKECIMYCILVITIYFLGSYAIYKTSDFYISRALLVLIVPVLVSTYRLIKVDKDSQ